MEIKSVVGRQQCGYLYYDLLGEGAYGRVYRISKKPTNDIIYPLYKKLPDNEYYALKELDPKLRQGNQNLDLNEIDILFRLDHPNLLNGLDILSNLRINCPLNGIGLVLPIYDTDLEKYLRKNQIPYAKRWQFVNELNSALNFLHKNNILHLDIKDENILIKIVNGQPSNLAISDYGLSMYTINSNIGLKTKRLVGNFLYRAPELLRAQNSNGDVNSTQPDSIFKYNSLVDVWSIGLVYLQIFGNLNSAQLENFVGGTELLENDDISPENYYKMLLDRFSSESNRTNLLNIVIPDDLPQREKAIELLSAVLTPYPQYRPTTTDISTMILQPLKYEMINGVYYYSDTSVVSNNGVLTMDNKKLNIDNLKFTAKYLLQVMNSYFDDVYLDFLFNTFDLFYQSVLEFNTDNPTDCLIIGLTSLFMNMKLFKISDNQEAQIIIQKLIQNKVEWNIFTNVELQIIQNLGGILYRNSVFPLADNYQELVSFCTYLLDPAVYYQVTNTQEDLIAWLNKNSTPINLKSKYTRVKDFLISCNL
jgi:serine/threonine protein kinase